MSCSSPKRSVQRENDIDWKKWDESTLKGFVQTFKLWNQGTLIYLKNENVEIGQIKFRYSEVLFWSTVLMLIENVDSKII